METATPFDAQAGKLVAEVLGQRVKQRREQLGLTQAAVAARIPIAQNAFSNIESANTSVNLSRLLDLGRALECDPLELVSHLGDLPLARAMYDHMVTTGMTSQEAIAVIAEAWTNEAA